MEDSANSVSSAESSIMITESFTSEEEFDGFAIDDTETNVKDPFQGIFYHAMPLQDSTNIMFYNKPMFNNILVVLSKQFEFPQEATKKFSVKTHVDSKSCKISVNREVTSLCVSGPGHISWMEKVFRRLAENLFRTFVKETSTLLNTSTDSQDRSSVTTSQKSTHPNESLMISTTQAPEEGRPVEPEEQQPDKIYTQLQDSPILRQVSAIMDMISTLQGQITTLTTQVNKLVEQAASESLYQTVEETSMDSSNIAQRTPHSQSEADIQCLGNTDAMAEQNSNNIELPSPELEIRDPQTHKYSEVVQMTSTPRIQTHNKPQRLLPIQRKTVRAQSQVPENQSLNDTLLIGDSIIGSINQKGLKPNVIKNGISGAKISHIISQIKVYDMKSFSNVIIYIGGNDASSGSDMEYFEELYEQVIQHIKQSNDKCQIFLCNICPRADTCVGDFNDIIQRLSEQHNAKLVDLDSAFHDRHEKIIERYYDTDAIHLSSSGVKRLLGSLNKQVSLVKDFDKCFFPKIHRKRPNHFRGGIGQNRYRFGRKSHQSGRDNLHVHCYKCGENNHQTSDCRHKKQLNCYQCGFLGHKSGRCLQK